MLWTWVRIVFGDTLRITPISLRDRPSTRHRRTCSSRLDSFRITVSSRTPPSPHDVSDDSTRVSRAAGTCVSPRATPRIASTSTLLGPAFGTQPPDPGPQDLQAPLVGVDPGHQHHPDPRPARQQVPGQVQAVVGAERQVHRDHVHLRTVEQREGAGGVLGGADDRQARLLPEPLGHGVGEHLVVVDHRDPDGYAGHGPILLVTGPRRHRQPPQHRLRQVGKAGGSSPAGGGPASSRTTHGRSSARPPSAGSARPAW